MYGIACGTAAVSAADAALMLRFLVALGMIKTGGTRTVA